MITGLRLILVVLLGVVARSSAAADVERWGTFELTLTGPSDGNPFVDVELAATFSQGEKRIATSGFYDGDGTYKVRFMPPTVGEWSYATRSNRPALDGKTGKFTVGEPSPGNHGPVRVRNTFHFEYADGTPHFSLGTTCYGWIHLGDKIEEQTLASLKTAPFNKVRMCVLPKWYAYNRAEPPLYPFVGKPPKEWDFARFDPAFFLHVEKRVAELRDLGIEADIILFHPYDEGHWGFDRMPAAADNLYLKYVVARLGAYRNVWWSLANEFDFMKEKNDADWEGYLKIVHEADPYRHLLSIHNGTRIWNHTDPRITHASIQNGSAVSDFGRALLFRDVYRKPIVFDEVKYEGNLEQRWGNLSPEEMVHRFWQGTIAGTYVGHGETYKHDADMIWWSKGGVLRGKSPERIAFLRKVFEEGPREGMEPIDKWQDEKTAGKRREYYLVYFGKEKPTEWAVDLPGKNEPPLTVTAEVLDTWNMTVKAVPGEFTLKPKGGYRMAADPPASIPLPGSPYMAIRLKAKPSEKKTGVRVDLSPDNGRGDVLAPGWDHWRVPAKPTATARFGEVTVTLRAKGKDATLNTGWWKPGFDYPARMASDGVTVDGPIELVIAGLTPGRHSLATYHSRLVPTQASRVTVTGPEGPAVTVTPSTQVIHDADAASGYVEFDVTVGKDVTVTIAPSAAGVVVLNGFELDRSDPARRATRPAPSDEDGHAPEKPVLTWRPAAKATGHAVYLGTDPTAVAKANTDSPEYRGRVKAAEFPSAAMNPNHHAPYYWRVDTIFPDGAVRGEVWRFRIRHLAFPEAEGYGRFAIGGRAGKVCEVTNLNDAGPGSLREAIEASGPRTVVFRVGGVIELRSKLVVRNPYLTVAGQTAPGDGICVANYTFGCSDTHDVVIRHVRIRVGDKSGTTQDGSGARGTDHTIYDHCSISWSIDEGFSSREGKNITVQRCLIAEALNVANHKNYQPGKGHSFAGSISGDVGSFHHNLLAHCTGRNWSLAGGLDRTGSRLAGRLDIRNNVVYNWQNRTTDGGVRELNFVNNFYIPGPATKTFTLLKPDPADWDRGMRAYMAGNVIEGKPALDSDNWAAFVGPPDGLAKVRQARPLFEPYVKTDSVKDAYANVIADVGATKPKQDAVDRRVIDDLTKRSHTFTGSRGKLPGIIDTPKDAGGLPAYESGTPPADSDHDGIPDDWEKAHGLNPANATDGAAFRGDGYTHLEHYLNELANPTDRPSTDPKYRETIHKRATAAVAAATVSDESKRAKAVTIVKTHYVAINDIHFNCDEAVKAATTDTAVSAVRSQAASAVAVVHATFTRDLAAVLPAEQCDAVKDKMTYDVRTNTFRVYCEMLPTLTDEEKAKVREFLLAGREEALVAGDADQKHAKFRIAKGKVANYLSSRGHDLKKAEADWAAKRKK